MELSSSAGAYGRSLIVFYGAVVAAAVEEIHDTNAQTQIVPKPGREFRLDTILVGIPSTGVAGRQVCRDKLRMYQPIASLSPSPTRWVGA